MGTFGWLPGTLVHGIPYSAGLPKSGWRKVPAPMLAT
jgi:hypothetical protein